MRHQNLGRVQFGSQTPLRAGELLRLQSSEEAQKTGASAGLVLPTGAKSLGRDERLKIAMRDRSYSGHRVVLARSCEPDDWRRLLHAQKERKVPQANCGQDRRRVRTAELDFGLSCTECTENDGRTVLPLVVEFM